MMMFYENVRLALFSLKANKMRALLTMLGIIIGISSVIAIMTVGQSLTYTMTESMSSLGVNNITVALQQKPQEEETTEEGMSFGGGMGRAMAGEEDYFTREMLENYCDTYEGSVVGISVTEGLGQSKLQNRGLYANVYVTGTSLGYFLANDLELLAGRYFSGTEMDEGRKVAMVSSIVVDNMFGGDEEQALGSMLQVNLGDKYFEFVVVGVYKYEQSAMGLSLVSEKDTQTDFYIPLKTAQEISHSQGFACLCLPSTRIQSGCHSSRLPLFLTWQVFLPPIIATTGISNPWPSVWPPWWRSCRICCPPSPRPLP